MEELFKDKEYCFAQIREARAIFGNKKTTSKQYDGMERALALMYLYCPEDIQWLVMGTIKEAENRRWYFEFQEIPA